MQETNMYARWQQLALSAKSIESDGHRLRVLQAGRLNRQRGPDFLAARFELDGVVYQGDVECHIHAGDWYAHGHHLDRAFANVELHVVAHSSTTVIRHLLNERTITTLCITPSTGGSPFAPCPLSAAEPSVLRELALRRFHLKIHAFQKQLAQTSFEQTFYVALLRALGYPSNGDGFQELARRLDIFWLQQTARSFWLNEDLLLSLYLGQASLLPFAPVDAFSKKAEQFYQNYRKLISHSAMDSRQWQFAGVRPANHPHLRLAAWCRLYLAHKENPWVFHSNLLRRRLPFSDLLEAIDAYFAVPRTAYWLNHYALDKSCREVKDNRFLGRGRVMEIVVNVLLPLFAAQALEEDSAGFFSYLEAFYLWLPLRAPYTSMRKQFPWIAAAQKEWPAQALYQAALHLYGNACRSGNCDQCPLK